MPDQPIRILIVEARFYEDLADALLDGASDALKAFGAHYDVVTVPGALEIPAAIAFADTSGDYDGYVALGCVIRGETYHFEVVANESCRGVMDVMLETGVPIANGILTVNSDAQAEARVAEKGADCAHAAIEMANALTAISASAKEAR